MKPAFENMEDLIVYEMTGNWLFSLVWFDWGQLLIVRYVVWKTQRKYRRYAQFREHERANF